MPLLLRLLYLHFSLIVARQWEVNQVHCISSHGLVPPAADSCYAAIQQISTPILLDTHVLIHVLDELPTVYRSDNCVITIEQQVEELPLMDRKSIIHWRRNTKRLAGDIVKCFEDGRGAMGAALTRSWVYVDRSGGIIGLP